MLTEDDEAFTSTTGESIIDPLSERELLLCKGADVGWNPVVAAIITTAGPPFICICKFHFLYGGISARREVYITK